MKLIFIYGPMGVGKFTTGKALAELTGYKFFHNHLTVMALRAIFPQQEPPYSDTVTQVRFICLKAAAEAGYDTIFTLGYSGAVDDEQVRNIVAAVEAAGGEVDFVQLYAPPEEILTHRIERASRRAMAKESSPARFKRVLAERDVYAAVPFANNLRIDNTKLAPEQTARRIAEHYGLPMRETTGPGIDT